MSADCTNMCCQNSTYVQTLESELGLEFISNLYAVIPQMVSGAVTSVKTLIHWGQFSVAAQQ